MRRILYWLRLVDLVWTIDASDGEECLRIVWHDKDGNCFVSDLIRGGTKSAAQPGMGWRKL